MKITELIQKSLKHDKEVEELSSQLDNKANKIDVVENLFKKRDKSELIKIGDLSQDVKESMTGGSVAVVGVGSTSFVNLASDLIESLGETSSIETVMSVGFMQTVGTVNTGNYGLYYTKVECVPGEQYSCDIKLYKTDGVLGIAFTNEDNVVISNLLSPNGSSINEVDYKFVIPTNCKYLYLSTRNNYVNLKKIISINVNNIKKNVENINKTINVLPNIEENIKNVINKTSEIKKIQQSFELTNGIYNYQTGIYQDFTGTSYTQYYSVKLNVNPNDILYVSCKVSGSNCRLAVFYDENDNYLSYFNGGTDNGTFVETKLVIPDNCYKVALTTYIPNNNPLTVTKEIKEIIDVAVVKENTNKNINNIDLLEFENKNLKRRCYNLEKNNEFEWKNFDKAYFIFVIDDCNSFLPPCWDLFKSKNTPLSSAVIVNRLYNVYTKYNTEEIRNVKTILNDIVSNNGEVLAHYDYDLYETSSYDEWNTNVRDVKIKLENEGFNIRGLIRANNTTNNTEKGEEYCRSYFDYSDGVGKSTQYNLKRKFFIGVNSLDDMKSYIDDCCNKKGIFPFCFHGNRDDEPLSTIENLSLIIDYINSKGDKAKITTYEYVYDNLGTTKLEKRLIALEGK